MRYPLMGYPSLTIEFFDKKSELRRERHVQQNWHLDGLDGLDGLRLVFHINSQMIWHDHSCRCIISAELKRRSCKKKSRPQGVPASVCQYERTGCGKWTSLQKSCTFAGIILCINSKLSEQLNNYAGASEIQSLEINGRIKNTSNWSTGASWCDYLLKIRFQPTNYSTFSRDLGVETIQVCSLCTWMRYWILGCGPWQFENRR